MKRSLRFTAQIEHDEPLEALRLALAQIEGQQAVVDTIWFNRHYKMADTFTWVCNVTAEREIEATSP